MFNAFYRLNDNPFSPELMLSSPYLSKSHTEALAHLSYGVRETGGFILLTGDEGSGKTTLLTSLIAHLPENTDVAVMHNPAFSEVELLADLCTALAIEFHQANLKHLIDCLSDFLQANHDKGHNTVLVIDNAQHLSNNLLEQLRLLTNLETDTQKLLQIILVGRPELKQHINQQALRQVAQRITVRYHLGPLTKQETSEYIAHRLRLCGLHEPLFQQSAVKIIAKYSAGNPKLINRLSERALMTAYGQSQNSIDARITQIAIADVLGIEPTRSVKIPLVAIITSLMLIGIISYQVLKAPDTQLAPESLAAQASVPRLTATAKAKATAFAHTTKATTSTQVLEGIRPQYQAKPIYSATRAQTPLVNLPEEPNNDGHSELIEDVEPIESTDLTQAVTPALIYITAKFVENPDINSVSSIDPKTNVQQQNWYVVQVYAGYLPPGNPQEYSCEYHELITRQHGDTFYITSLNLNLADAREIKQKLKTRCQLDSWVKPLPKSWRPLLTATR
ncbi:ExeA family protein [Shewanella violacea]|uniref:General secretion pathway protein A, putative n=1 Tax=Shewanella violacea (strain JCM 10179 / CIP 106290 / LMG 19151 / DSS12) TaxID=637905 RepID=D4ZM83_SHEVD|nr:AAA family ATPase [Shewanella violacea]BAJ02782.1 general secretion pathway protein A, putative [Shewanella violacea DSS12]